MQQKSTTMIILKKKIVVAKIRIHNKNMECCKLMNMLWIHLKNILLIFYKGQWSPNFNSNTDKKHQKYF